jgi:hypothetical protein
MAWFTLSNLRFLLTTETDADSPIPEELMSQIRENLEVLFMLLFDTNITGTATSTPTAPNADTLTDTSKAWDVDQHNERTLLITSGTAQGNTYTIDDTTATTLVCGGDDLESDGVLSGDSYRILYDIKDNADGHDHDGVNSKESGSVADGVISQAKLKTTTGSVSQAGAGHQTLPGGTYGFYPQTKRDGGATVTAQIALAYAQGTYGTYIYLDSSHANSIYAQQRYVQSSGEINWLFFLRNKQTGIIESAWFAPDHPCFGNGAKPELTPHPWPDRDMDKYEVIVCHPTHEEVKEMRQAQKDDDPLTPDRDILQVIADDYEFDEAAKPKWPDKEITVDLPDDWDDAWLGNKPVKPIKMKIKKPKGIKHLTIKKKP